jgi:hypothetical protein
VLALDFLSGLLVKEVLIERFANLGGIRARHIAAFAGLHILRDMDGALRA